MRKGSLFDQIDHPKRAKNTVLRDKHDEAASHVSWAGRRTRRIGNRDETTATGGSTRAPAIDAEVRGIGSRSGEVSRIGRTETRTERSSVRRRTTRKTIDWRDLSALRLNLQTALDAACMRYVIVTPGTPTVLMTTTGPMSCSASVGPHRACSSMTRLPSGTSLAPTRKLAVAVDQRHG